MCRGLSCGILILHAEQRQKRAGSVCRLFCSPDIILREKSLAQEHTLELRAERRSGVHLQGDPPVHVVDVQQIGTRAVTDRNKLQIAGSKGTGVSKSIHHLFLQISCDSTVY